MKVRILHYCYGEVNKWTKIGEKSNLLTNLSNWVVNKWNIKRKEKLSTESICWPYPINTNKMFFGLNKYPLKYNSLGWIITHLVRVCIYWWKMLLSIFSLSRFRIAFCRTGIMRIFPRYIQKYVCWLVRPYSAHF